LPIGSFGINVRALLIRYESLINIIKTPIQDVAGTKNFTLGEIGMKTALVCGAGGAIGSHLVERLKSQGAWAMGVDWKQPASMPPTVQDVL